MSYPRNRVWASTGVAVVLAATLAGCSADGSTSSTELVPAAVEESQAVAAAPQDAAVASSPANDQHDTNLDALPISSLSDQETADLLYMREEEKLARDVYLAMADLWGARVFTNIADSEQKHMTAILSLLDRYGLDDPVGSNDVGVFADPGLQDLYDSLIEQGSASLVDAFLVGAAIEDLDIADLGAAIAATDNEDIELVFGSLLAGSHNHMRAFSRQLERSGTAFVPTHMTVEDYEAIISSGSGRGVG